MLFAISCADGVEYPSSYTYASTTIQEYFVFEFNDGEFIEVEPEDYPEPSLAFIDQSASIKKLEFLDATKVLVTDGFDTEEIEYTGSQNRIFMDKDGQAIELVGTNDGSGSQFESKSIAVGDFDGVSQNVYVSALCGDIVNCFDLNAEAWVQNAGLQNGELQYVIIRNDLLLKD